MNNEGDEVDQFIYYLKNLGNDWNRERIFSIVCEQFCIYCGKYHGDQTIKCQCWNDE